MTVGYIDSSCLVAVAFGESGYEDLAARMESIDQLYASNLLEAELRAAFHREGIAAGRSILGGISWVMPDRPLSEEISAVLAAGYLRGADLWHLACALYLSPDPAELVFLTADRQQAGVAAIIGFGGVDVDSAAG